MNTCAKTLTWIESQRY